MVFSITPQQSIRFTYNEAFQVANYSEFFLFAQVTNTEAFAFLDSLCVQNGTKCGFSSLPVMALGNENLDLEVTEGWEVGYSAVIGKRAFLTVDYYRSDNTQFITDLLPQFIAPLEAPDFKTNPAIPDWVARPDWNDIQVSPDQTLADVLSASLNFLGRINGVQPSNDPRDNSTIVVARTYTNFGEVSTQGVDLGFSYFFSDALNLRFSYSWFDFEPKESNQPIDPEIQDRLLLANTPENKFSLVLSYRKPRWGIGIAGRWVEDFPWSAGLFEGPVADNQPNSFSSSPYSTADLTGDYMVTDKWKLGLVFSNVFGQRNYQAFGGDLLDRRALIYGQFDW